MYQTGYDKKIFQPTGACKKRFRSIADSCCRFCRIFFYKKKNNASVIAHAAKDSMLSKKAFQEVYNVLMSPRCMNCHPSGDIPLVGDDSELHTQGVKRGKDGKGMYASKCANCHKRKSPGFKYAAGNPNWHLPPANMKMVFQGKTPRELAAQLLDRQQMAIKQKQTW